MAKEMLINVSEGEECRIALVEDGVLEELYMERTSSTSHVNNIYKGRVVNVEPSIQAAFIDFGLGRNGFLHISDLMPTYFGRRGEEIQESVGRKMARRDRPPIQRCLRRGDSIVVQVIKEGIGTKGPTLSSYLSIPGKILVMMPGMVSKGVSRKIEDDAERRRLRQILDQLDPPEDIGFIIRTAGVGKSKAEIERDLKYLLRLWQTIEKKRDSSPGPTELYTEGDLVSRTVRDVFSTDVDRLIIDNKEVAQQVKEVVKLSSPRARNRVDLYDEPIPLFHKYGIEKEIEQMYSRHVPLPSGGSLVIDSTEAIVAIDVNSGKFRDHSDAETTAFKTDMEAADEICRQLRLRDLGGVIICDFIDLRYERHRRELEGRLHENLRNDRAKTKVLRMSQFGIIEMTRQRMRPSFKRSVYFDCPHCKGAGLVKTPESMSLDVMRRLAIAANDQRVIRVELSVSPDVAFYLQNRKRARLAELEHRTAKQIVIRPEQGIGLDEMRLALFDNRDGLVIVPELAAALESHPHTSQLNVRQPHAQRGRPGAGRDDRRPQRPPQPQPRHRDELGDDEDVMEDRASVLEHEADEAAAPSPHVPQDQRDRRPQFQQRGPQQDRPGRQAPPVRQPPPSGRSDFDADAGSEAPEEVARSGGGNGFPSQNGDNFGDEQGGGRKRRRRRRGRRGRGRGGQNLQDQNQQNRDPNQPPQFADRRDEAPRDEQSDEAGTDEYRADEAAFERADSPAGAEDSRESGELVEDFGQRPFEQEPIGEAPQPISDTDDSDGVDTGEPESFADERVEITAEAQREEARQQEPQREPEAPVEEKAEAEAPEPKKKGRRPRKPAKAKTPAAKERTSEEESSETAAKPRRRGTRGGRKKKAAKAAAEAKSQAKEPVSAESSRSESAAAAPVSSRRVAADKHLADDEPVMHEPVRRPRSMRDLDSIPDDFD